MFVISPSPLASHHKCAATSKWVIGETLDRKRSSLFLRSLFGIGKLLL